jgi:hypothetical protein
MSAGKYNFTCEQGATFDRIITYKDSDGVAVNLSNYTANMHIREYAGGPLLAAFSSNSTSNGACVIDGTVEASEDGANGNVRVFMAAANTSILPTKSLRYDLELRSQTGYVTRLIEGKFNVVPEITE